MKKLTALLLFALLLSLTLALTSCDLVDLSFLNGLPFLNGDGTTGTTAACQHTFGEWVTRTEATCRDAGERFRTCSRCSEEEPSRSPPQAITAL